MNFSWEQVVTIGTVMFFAGLYVGSLTIMWSEIKRMRDSMHEVRDILNKINVTGSLAAFETHLLKHLNDTYVRKDVLAPIEKAAEEMHGRLDAKIDSVAHRLDAVVAGAHGRS